MPKLHDALKALEPINFCDVPMDKLDTFLKDIYSKAELAINSVPPPAGGEDFLSASLSQSDANVANSSADLTVSSARPPPRKSTYAELQKQWGKPMKLNAKENPLGTSMFKMAGNDRHGAWFARSSVHEGIGFSKFKKALLQEFPETLKVEGGPGAGSIRGIGGDRRIERNVVDGVGSMEVYQLSAQFPGPTTPREFITLFMTSDSALGDDSLPDSTSKVPQVIPRHLMMISKPVTHPEAQPREGYVLGRYESIEFIREIPLTLARSNSSSNLLDQASSPNTKRMPLGRKRSSTIGFAESRGPDAKGERRDRGTSPNALDPELNPVEWLMITRSDPGGGIPRFMVERGTPSSIAADAAKFLDWACSKEENWFDEQKANNERHDGNATAVSSEADEKDKNADTKVTSDGAVRDSQQEENDSQNNQSDSDTSSSDTSSVDSFTSARQFGNVPAERRYSASSSSSSSSPIPSEARSAQTSQRNEQVLDNEQKQRQQQVPTLIVPPTSSSVSSKLPPEDKVNRTLAKLDQNRTAINTRLDRVRERENTRIRETTSKTQDEREHARARERADREIRKHEDRHARDLAKLDAKRHKAVRKAEMRLRKAGTKDSLLSTQHERDAARAQVDALKTENGLLKVQVGELQRENTALVARLGKSDEGQRVLQLIREDANNSSGTSGGNAGGVGVGGSGGGSRPSSVVGVGGGNGGSGAATGNTPTRSRASSMKSEASATAAGFVKKVTTGSLYGRGDGGNGSGSGSGNGAGNGSGLLSHIKAAATSSPLASGSTNTGKGAAER